MSASSSSFEEFYVATHDRLVASLAVLVGDLDVASEATDEAFERAVTRWGRVSQMESPAGWTYRVALNVARRHGRRRSLERRLLAGRREVPTLPTPVVEVRDILAVLPTRQRAAMTLRVLGDLTETEIADALGVSRSTVQSALADARRNLAEVAAESMERSGHEDAARPS